MSSSAKAVPAVEIVEVSPRDGLQNEDRPLEVETKLELVTRLIDAGVRRIEAVSFAHPKRVPRLADAEELMALVPRDRGVSYAGLVLNRRGLDRAQAAGVDEINYVVVVSGTFSERNQGMTVDESITSWLDIGTAAKEAGLRTAVTLSAAFGCPFEGEISPGMVLSVLERVLPAAPDEIVLADTIGVGFPAQVRTLVAGARAIDPDVRLRAHFHDTRGTGIANALAAVECGITVLDASTGGIGGCPFAPGATGNIATEDLLYALQSSGADTGIDPSLIIATGTWIAEVLGLRCIPASLGRAGWFPANAIE
jgi:hydroxymethylglutaryl-CoA lyase